MHKDSGQSIFFNTFHYILPLLDFLVSVGEWLLLLATNTLSVIKEQHRMEGWQDNTHTLWLVAAACSPPTTNIWGNNINTSLSSYLCKSRFCTNNPLPSRRWQLAIHWPHGCTCFITSTLNAQTEYAFCISWVKFVRWSVANLVLYLLTSAGDWWLRVFLCFSSFVVITGGFDVAVDCFENIQWC